MSEQKIYSEATDPLYQKDKTGRSTRMMLEAVQAVNDGKKAVVIFKDDHTAQIFRDKFGPIPGLSLEPMKVKPSMEINWIEMKLEGERADHLLFLDHSIFESTFKHILRAWTKYDLPIKE